jgi:exonuclease III
MVSFISWNYFCIWEKIEEMLETFELQDPWRTCFPNGRKYTWRQSSSIKQSRLDYFLVSEDLFSLMIFILRISKNTWSLHVSSTFKRSLISLDK